MNRTLGMRKVIGGLILTLLWIFCFMFIKSTLVIDWNGDGSNITSLKLVVVVIGLLVIVLYHIFYRSNAATTKLSLTADLTLAWLALILFFPFKALSVGDGPGGVVGFFALIFGLAVCVLWVHFFSDEIVAS